MPRAAAENYYEVLGVARDANSDAIRDAFRQLALKYHPDHNKSPDAEQRFKEIAEAYAVLSDPKKRAQYDAQGRSGLADFSPEDLLAGIDFGDIFGDAFGDMAGSGMGPGGLFERLFRRRAGAETKGRDMEVLLRVPLETIARGGPATVSLTRTIVCPSCHGTGARSGTGSRPCEVCGGTGQKVVVREDEGVRFRHVTTCPACGGTGRVIDEPCPVCGGRGKVEREERLEVIVPAGAEEGMALRIPGHGSPSRDPRGTPGDLLVVIRSAPDDRFERWGADLWRDETLDVADAALGTRLWIPTMDGEVEVSVPAGTQPEQILRVRGKGLPVFGSDQRGDMNVRVHVSIPRGLSDLERELYRQLRALRAGSREHGAGRGPGDSSGGG